MSADFKEGLGDLTEGAGFDGLHEFVEEVAAFESDFFELGECEGRAGGVSGLEVGDARDLGIFFGVGGAGELDLDDAIGGVGIEEGVDADDGEFAVVFFGFVVEGFFLDFGALVHEFHGTEYAAAFGDAVEFGEDSFFDDLGEVFDDVGALVGVFVFEESEFAGEDELDSESAADGFFGGGGDGFVVGVGVEGVAVIGHRVECLEGGADIVEGDLLGVEGAARGLDVVFELLRAFVCAVEIAHGDGPDAAGDATDDGVFGVDAVAKEEREVAGEVIHVHAASAVVFGESEAVGEGEGELRDGVCAGFGDMVAGDGDGVEVLDLVGDEVGLDIAHHFEGEVGGEDAGILGLIFFEDIGLDGTTDLFEGAGADLGVFFGGDELIARDAEESETLAVVTFGELGGAVGREVGGELSDLLLSFGPSTGGFETLFDLLIDGGIEEHSEEDRGGSVDGHGDAGFGGTQIEAGVEAFCVIEGGYGNAGVADFAVDIGSFGGIASVERDGVKGGGEAGGGLPFG